MSLSLTLAATSIAQESSSHAQLIHLRGPTRPHLSFTIIGSSLVQIYIIKMLSMENFEFAIVTSLNPVNADWNLSWLAMWTDGQCLSRRTPGQTESHWCEISVPCQRDNTKVYLQLYCTHFHSYWWWWWNTFSTKYYKQKKFWWLLNYWMLVALKFDAQPMMEWTPTTIALMRHFSNITLKKEGYFHHHNHQKYQNHNQNYHFHHYMVL